MPNYTVQVAASALQRAMKIAGQIVERRNTLPILSNVLFDARDGQLVITATNLDVQFVQTIEADVDEPIAVTIPSEKLSKIASLVDGDAFLKFAVEKDHRLRIVSGRSRWMVATLPAADFSKMPEMEAEAVLEIDAANLAGLITRTLPFVSSDPARYYLHGVYWHSVKNAVCVAGTNGHVLLRIVDAQTEWPERAPSVILPTKACQVLVNLSEAGGVAGFKWNENRFSFELGDSALVAKVIDGSFPNYEKQLPQAVEKPLIADPSLMSRAVRSLMVAADQETNAVKIDAEHAGLLFAMQSKDGLTQAQEQVPAEVGDQPATAFNQKYLKTMLDGIGGDTITIHQSAPREPARIERVVDDGALGALWPMAR